MSRPTTGQHAGRRKTEILKNVSAAVCTELGSLHRLHVPTPSLTRKIQNMPNNQSPLDFFSAASAAHFSLAWIAGSSWERTADAMLGVSAAVCDQCVSIGSAGGSLSRTS